MKASLHYHPRPMVPDADRSSHRKGPLDRIVGAIRRIEWARTLVLSMRRLRERRVERRLGIDTLTPVEGNEGAIGIVPDAVMYQPVDYPLLEAYLAPLAIGADDVVCDIGCGMGRILCLCSLRGVRRCVGIELGPRLAERARLNAASLRASHAPIEVRTEDATQADYSDATVIIMFNPFGAETMRATLARIEASWKANPRPIRMLYINPAHEDVLAESAWLRRTDARDSRWHRLTASYWTSVPSR